MNLLPDHSVIIYLKLQYCLQCNPSDLNHRNQRNNYVRTRGYADYRKSIMELILNPTQKGI